MAVVVLPNQVAARFGSRTRLEIEAGNVRQLYEALERLFPGLGSELRQESAIAIDGEIIQEPLLEALEPGSEVHFLPPISGGSALTPRAPSAGGPARAPKRTERLDRSQRG